MRQGHLQEDVGGAGSAAGARVCAGGLTHQFELAGAGAEVKQGLREACAGEFVVGKNEGGAIAGEGFGVMSLVVVGGEREGDEEAGAAGGCKFADRAGASAADDEIGVTIGGGHVIEKCADCAAQARGGKGLGRGFLLGFARLDGQVDGRLREQREGLPGGAIEGLGATAAAGDEDPEDRARRAPGYVEKLVANGEAAEFGPSGGEESAGLVELNQGPASEAGEAARDKPGDGIGLHGSDGDAAQDGREQGWSSGIAAETEHGRRAETGQQDRTAGHAGWQLEESAEGLVQSNALETPDVDPLDAKAARRSKPGLETAAGADEEALVTTPAQLGGDREQRKHVATGAAAGHHETQLGGFIHARQPDGRAGIMTPRPGR